LNKLLSYMSASDHAEIEPLLEEIYLPHRFKLAQPRRLVEHVYFLDSGLASIVVKGRDGQETEVAVVGNEGASGCPVFLEVDRSAQDVYMQGKGTGRRIRADVLSRLIADRPSLRRLLLQYAHTVSVQQDETALAATRGTIPERLARWLLMAQDRLGDDLDLTHDFLATMLGIRRPGVTVALSEFRQAGLTSSSRGNVHVQDRAGLLSLANIFYGAPGAEYDRLFPARADLAL
jgi:CRP-like cAMP-binding protein